MKIEKLSKIAIIAHDGKKAEMVAFLKDYVNDLDGVDIVATGTTGKFVAQAGLKVDAKLSGPLGGDAQIAAMVVEEQIQAVFFFRDPLGKHPHEPDVQMLMRLCDLHNVPLATNPVTGRFLIKGMIDSFNEKEGK
ncbi:methylglyoxal synthase [Flammeovirgaceae bacterium SG7u.111]|nr:methylglyoxal synthase [Flammeovirgaceae bacterium SG7u.132]WPO38564.1 methylglyoxal synthase [Flammeovirgaceae bacterium SG7u.111]